MSAMKFLMILVTLCVACTTSVKLEGQYIKYQWYESGPNPFTFQVGGVTVEKPNDYTESISQLTEMPSLSSDKVQCLVMDYNNLKYMPANYIRFFPLLQYLMVRHAHVKYVTNTDFLGLEYLFDVNFEKNEIEHLPGNLFQGMSNNLATISFADNKITNVGPNFIANLPGLKDLLLIGNPCINLNTPVNLKLFQTTFKTKCQLPKIPDVIEVLPPTYEEYTVLNTTTVDLINKNNNLTTEFKLCQDRNKLSLAKLQTDLTNAQNSLQKVKLKPVVNEVVKPVVNEVVKPVVNEVVKPVVKSPIVDQRKKVRNATKYD